MGELSRILLIAGLLCIAGFEWWRARRNRPTGTVTREGSSGAETSSAPRAPLPDLHVARDSRVSVDEALPVIELASPSASGTRRPLGITISEDFAVDLPREDAAPSPTATPRVQSTRSEPYIGQDDDVS